MNEVKEEKTPALVEVLKTFDNELSQMDGVTCEIKNKCNQIFRLEEPINEGKDTNKTNDIIGELKLQLQRFQNYNQRLKDIHKHLNRIMN